MLRLLIPLTLISFVLSCTNNDDLADAYGNFEVDEILISAKAQGELLHFNVKEGDALKKGDVIGYIDTLSLHLQRAELAASILTTEAQRENVEAQIRVAQDDLKRLKKDQDRIRKMYNQNAATQKQLDDINSAVDIKKRNLEVLQTQYPAIAAQAEAINAKNQLLNQRIKDAIITNPVEGIVLNKLVQEHEFIAPGKGLYIIANTQEMFLRAYISADQLPEIKLGQEVKVYTDATGDEMKEGKGSITWISDKSEFTPKTIQTKNERANTVYAFKVNVVNDGTYKIGMHGEIKFN